MKKNPESDPKKKRSPTDPGVQSSTISLSGEGSFRSEGVTLRDMRAVPMAAPESRLGERVRYARNDLNLSVEALSRLTKEYDLQGLGLSPTSIARYESGESLPGIREFRILCAALEIPLAWLLYGDVSGDESNKPQLTEAERIVLVGLRAMMIESKTHEAYEFKVNQFELDRYKAEMRTAKLAKARKP